MTCSMPACDASFAPQCPECAMATRWIGHAGEGPRLCPEHMAEHWEAAHKAGGADAPAAGVEYAAGERRPAGGLLSTRSGPKRGPRR